MKPLLTTPQVIAWIKNGRPARILHLFDEVVNLVNDLGNVISLSTTAIGPGPFSLIMDDTFPTAISQISIEDKIETDSENQSFTIGALQFATSQLPLWNPRPDWELLKRALPMTSISERSLPPEVETQLENLLRAYVVGDFAAGRLAVEAMAGLGTGLTPSGDDVLMGTIYALWVWTPNSLWIDLIAGWAEPLTTTLSAAYLRAAFRGEATIHWHNLVAGEPDAVDQILSIGHSSGREAWAGFSTAYNTILRTH